MFTLVQAGHAHLARVQVLDSWLLMFVRLVKPELTEYEISKQLDVPFRLPK